MTPRSLLAPARLGGQPILRAQTDERLVDLARSGSRPAFEAIVARYRRPLLAYSARFLGMERAEDAVQQTFVKAYTALAGGEFVRTLRPWLYRIAHNASLNMLRDRALFHEPLAEQVDGVERPDQAAERRQELHLVLAAVKALPARQRDAIVLQALEGRTYEEIAEALGVSDGAVRQLLSRARCGVRAGVAAITPLGFLARIAGPFGDAPATAIAGGGGGGATFAAGKLCAAALATAIAGGGVGDLPDRPGDRGPGDRREASSAERVSDGRLAVASSSSTASSSRNASHTRGTVPATPRGRRVGNEAPARAGEPREREPRTADRDHVPSSDGADVERSARGDRAQSQGGGGDRPPPSRSVAPLPPRDGGFDSRQRPSAPPPRGDLASAGVEDHRSASADGPYAPATH